MMTVRACGAALALVFALSPAIAQQQSEAQQPGSADQWKFAYEGARNQLGLLGYCQTEGHIDGQAIEIQKAMLAQIPPPSDISGGDKAEAEGKKGAIAAMGVNQRLEEVAVAQKTTAAALCTSISNAMKQAGAAMQQGEAPK